MFHLPYIPSAEKLLDDAFRAGAREAKKVRSTRKPRDVRMRLSEERRIHIISKKICGELSSVVEHFPSYEQLPLFYRKLFDIRLDKDRYKKSLGALSWVCTKIKTLESDSVHAVRKRQEAASKYFLGRASSYVKRVSAALEYLAEVAKILKSFPTVRDLPTLVVAGYPNVGKSTFVRNLTGSKVEVASYPFTTKSISIGYVKAGHQTIQVIDSPGLLDRPMADRNKIELQAVLALSELSDKIFFIVDSTMDVEPQVKLLREVSESFDVELFVGVNKVDVAEENALSEVSEKLKDRDVFMFSANNPIDCKRIFDKIF